MKKIGIIVAVFAFFVLAFLFLRQVAHRAMSNPQSEALVQTNEGVAAESANGIQIYRQKCVACHQANGLGIPGTFPPLKGSDFLKTAPKKRIIEQVLNGSNGGLVVNHMKYNTSMPPQTANVSEAIAVVNYILNAWGNHYGKATPQDARGVKAGKRKHRMMENGRMGRMGMCKIMPSGKHGPMMGLMK